MSWLYGWLPYLGKRPLTDNTPAPEEQPKPKKIKVDLDLIRKLGNGTRNGQARITYLNAGQRYKLCISNYLSATVKGGELGSLTVTGEEVTIWDANNIVFTGDRGDLITIEDNQNDGMSTAITMIGAGNVAESSVKMTGSNMYTTDFKINTVAQEEMTLQHTARAQINVSTSTQQTQDANASQNESRGYPLPVVHSGMPILQPQPAMQFNSNAARVTPSTNRNGTINSTTSGREVFLQVTGNGLMNMNGTRNIGLPNSTRHTGSGLLNEPGTVGLPIDTRYPKVYCSCNAPNRPREDQNQAPPKERGFSAVNI